MKKGFTLVELLAVLVIVGIVAGITTPVVSKMIKSSKQKAYDNQISFIERKAMEWSVSNSESLDLFYVTIEELANTGYIDEEHLTDPRNGKRLTGCVKISKDPTFDQYVYSYGNYCDKHYSIDLYGDEAGINITKSITTDSVVIDLSDYDYSMYHALSCESDASYSMQGNKLAIGNINSNIKCYFEENFTNAWQTHKYIYMIADDTVDISSYSYSHMVDSTLDLNGKTLTFVKAMSIASKLNITSSSGVGTIYAPKITINTNVNIENANIISNSATILNIKSGTTTISGRAYIATFATQWAPAINISDAAVLRINSASTPGCTADPNETVGGVCVYAPGDPDSPASSAGNIAIYTQNNSRVYISGGSYYAGQTALYSASSISTNIKNARLYSNYKTLVNASSGTFNLCSSNVYGVSKDIKASGTGTFNYDAAVVFKNGTNTPATEGSGTIAGNYTGTCE